MLAIIIIVVVMKFQAQNLACSKPSGNDKCHSYNFPRVQTQGPALTPPGKQSNPGYGNAESSQQLIRLLNSLCLCQGGDMTEKVLGEMAVYGMCP